MTFDLSEEFIVRSGAGIKVEENKSFDLIMEFDLTKWFKFDNEETNKDQFDFNDITDTAITLDEDSEDAAKSIREVVKDNIKDAMDYGKDEDRDGDFDNL